MSKNPIELANILLIVMGFVLIGSGPVISYRTVMAMLSARKKDPSASLHWVSNGLNFVIAVVFFCAGILFVINNLRGNPLAG